MLNENDNQNNLPKLHLLNFINWIDLNTYWRCEERRMAKTDGIVTNEQLVTLYEEHCIKSGILPETSNKQ